MVFIHTLSPVLLKLGPLEIRWYGLMYALTFIIVVLHLRKASREKKIPLTYDEIDTLLTWLVVSMIVGARLFAVFIWEPTYYLANPYEIIAVWHGGLSFHGGALGMFVAAVIFCKKKKIPLLHFCDIIIVPLALGQALGRIGNFMNSELYGPTTTLPWGINFIGETTTAGNLIFRHPTMLYEAGYDIFIFGILAMLKQRKTTQGTIFGTFLVLYGIFRSITELFRVEEVSLGPFTAGQLLNIPMIVAGVYLLYKNKTI